MYEPLRIISTETRALKYPKVCILVIIIFLLLFCLSSLKTANKNYITSSSEDDYHKLIDISFDFVHVPNVCANLTSKFLVAVHTAPKNFDKRQVVRQTWGSYSNDTKVIFMLGKIEDEATNKKLQAEIADYDDIVQGNFMDSYHNLTYKHVMVLKYVVYHCSKVDYLLKVDDDAFVNMPFFLNFIDEYYVKYHGSADILCKKIIKAKVKRTGKWAISKEYYRADLYPTYCYGYSIIYPIETVSKLYATAQEVPYFWIDDVHVTGILRDRLKIEIKDADPLILKENVQKKIINKKAKKDVKPFIFGDTNISPGHIKIIWDYALKHMPNKRIVDYL